MTEKEEKKTEERRDFSELHQGDKELSKLNLTALIIVIVIIVSILSFTFGFYTKSISSHLNNQEEETDKLKEWFICFHFENLTLQIITPVDYPSLEYYLFLNDSVNDTIFNFNYYFNFKSNINQVTSNLYSYSCFWIANHEGIEIITCEIANITIESNESKYVIEDFQYSVHPRIIEIYFLSEHLFG